MVPGRRYRVFISRPVELPRGTGDAKQRALAITQRVTSILEGFIRQRPEQWLWLHRRWRYGDEALDYASDRPSRHRRVTTSAPSDDSGSAPSRA